MTIAPLGLNSSVIRRPPRARESTLTVCTGCEEHSGSISKRIGSLVHDEAHLLWQQTEFGAPHTVPHPPQFFGSVVSSVQAPAQQEDAYVTPPSDPTPSLQAFPHFPQFSGSSFRFVHPAPQHDWFCVHPGDPHAHVEPFVHTPPQHTEPDAQTCPHEPQLEELSWSFTHVPLQHVSPAAQALPHLPQLLLSVFGFVQAFPDGLSQQIWFNVHVGEQAHVEPVWHAPLQQTEPAEQTIPQPPQLLLLSLVSVQVPLQHVPPFWHRLPHLPQFSLSLLRLEHPVPQHDWFCEQPGLPQSHVVPLVHFPLQHTEPDAHCLPQAPQLLLLSARSTQDPLQQASLLPQTLPHLPQFVGSLLRFSQTSPALVVQQVKVSPHEPLQAHVVPTLQKPPQHTKPAAH